MADDKVQYSVPDIFGTVDHFSADDIFKEEAKIVEDIDRSRRLIESALDELLDGTSDLSDGDKDHASILAFEQAANLVDEVGLGILLKHVRKALYTSGEFNYAAFVNQMVGACTLKYPEMVDVVHDTENNKIITSVDFSPLGDIELYAAAVETVREQLQSDKEMQVVADPGMRSHFWKEKIYGAGREGRMVLRRKYNRQTKEYEMIDVTDSFTEKYDSTIAARLNLFNNDEAPFWPLLEYGHSAYGAGGGGTAYPKLRGQHFISKIGKEIDDVFKSVYYDLRGKLREKILDRKQALLRDLEQQDMEQPAGIRAVRDNYVLVDQTEKVYVEVYRGKQNKDVTKFRSKRTGRFTKESGD